MGTKRTKSEAAFALVEAMLVTLILSVAVIGASGYRYYAAIDARKAKTRITAARIGMLVCESWRGVKGDNTYNPITYFSSDLTITQSTAFGFASGHPITGPVIDQGFTPLGTYKVVSDDTDYYAILSYKDVSPGLRALNVFVAWPWTAKGTFDTISLQASSYKLFKLTTYTSL